MFVCKNCSSTQSQSFIRNTKDRLNGVLGAFEYVRCSDCTMVQISEVPENLGEYYGNYRLHTQESWIYRTLARWMLGNSYLRWNGSGKTLLDVGCGNGRYMREMAERGWSCSGYEQDGAYAKSLSSHMGRPVFSGEKSLEPHAGEFDLVTLNYSFEHLANPLTSLRAFCKCVRKGGQIAIGVPNMEGREARVFGSRWFHLDAPRHISFFSKEHLKAVLSQEGFEAIRFENVHAPTGFAGSVSYCMRGKFSPILWYGAMIPGILFSLIIRDGLYRIIATKS